MPLCAFSFLPCVCNCTALVFIAGIVSFSARGTLCTLDLPVSPVDVYSFKSFDEAVICLNVSLFFGLLNETSRALFKLAFVVR